MTHFNQQIRLPDGRRLGYDEYGPRNGAPLFYFHGSPSSRLEFKLFGNEQLLQSLDVRLLALDRPGMGLSDFQPGRRFLDWPKDVLALADHLNIERFAVLAYSLGGPYGLACAYAIPRRLTRAGIISGPAPHTDPEVINSINEGTRRFLNLSREKPWLSRLFLWTIGMTARLAPDKFVAQAVSLLPEPDRQIVSDPEFTQGFLAMVLESLKKGARGAQHESLLTVTDWGFRPQDIRLPVLLWHGEEDRNNPVAMGRWMAEAIPNCHASFYPGEGHLSLFKNNAREFIQSVSVHTSE